MECESGRKERGRPQLSRQTLKHEQLAKEGRKERRNGHKAGMASDSDSSARAILSATQERRKVALSSVRFALSLVLTSHLSLLDGDDEGGDDEGGVGDEGDEGPRGQ